MRIGDVAARLGISREWLRRLERAGKLPPAARDINGHRRYSPQDIAAMRRALLNSKRREVPEEHARLRDWCERNGIPWRPASWPDTPKDEPA
jgi:DNA-binding transcriptional MerR regulator